MKRKHVKFLILAVAAFVFLGASSFNSDLLAAKNYTIRLAHSNAPDPYKSLEQMWSIVFKGIVESKTGGQVKVEIYPAGQLGGQREIIESTQIGTIEMGSAADAVVSNFNKDTMIFTMPFLFENIDDSYKLWQSAWGEKWANSFRKETGLRIVGVAGYGFRCLTNDVRPIHSPADAKGLKFRVMESPVPLAMIQGLGASAQPISAPELYSALQQGVVDGQENPLTSITSYKYYEVQKYLTLDEHQLGTQITTINERFFQSLPKDIQQIIIEAGQEACFAQMGGCTIINKGTGMEIANKEMKVYAPTAKEREAFKAAMQPPARKVIENAIGKGKVAEAMKAIEEILNNK